ncbi:hypothetical protein ABH937_006360 [Kitasatospora sp. GAS1066B]
MIMERIFTYTECTMPGFMTEADLLKRAGKHSDLKPYCEALETLKTLSRAENALPGAERARLDYGFELEAALNLRQAKSSERNLECRERMGKILKGAGVANSAVEADLARRRRREYQKNERESNKISNIYKDSLKGHDKLGVAALQAINSAKKDPLLKDYVHIFTQAEAQLGRIEGGYTSNQRVLPKVKERVAADEERVGRSIGAAANLLGKAMEASAAVRRHPAGKAPEADKKNMEDATRALDMSLAAMGLDPKDARVKKTSKDLARHIAADPPMSLLDQVNQFNKRLQKLVRPEPRPVSDARSHALPGGNATQNVHTRNVHM